MVSMMSLKRTEIILGGKEEGFWRHEMDQVTWDRISWQALFLLRAR